MGEDPKVEMPETTRLVIPGDVKHAPLIRIETSERVIAPARTVRAIRDLLEEIDIPKSAEALAAILTARGITVTIRQAGAVKRVLTPAQCKRGRPKR
jgi:hypothetical protein